MRLTLWAAVAAATLLRLFCVAIPAEEGFLQADSPSYLGPAMALLSTGEYRSCPGCDTPSFRLPLYPAFVASVFSPFGSCPRCVVAAQHLIAIGSAALLATAVGLGAGPWIRALVFLFLLANIQMIAQASVVLRESVTGSVVCLSLWLAAKPLDRLPRTIGLGLTVGSLGLCRPEYWPLAVLFPLVLALDGPRRGQRARFVPFVLVLAACSPLAAWFIRSQIVAPQTGLSTDSLTSVVSHLMLRRIEAHDRGLSIEAAGALVRERFPKGKGLPSPIALVWTRPWAVTRSCLEASGRFWFLPGGYGELLEVFQQPLASPLKQLIAGPQSVNWKTWLIERPGVFFLMITNVAQLALLYGAFLGGLMRKGAPWTDAAHLALLIVATATIAGGLTGDARVRGCVIPALVFLSARAWTARRVAAAGHKGQDTPAIGLPSVRIRPFTPHPGANSVAMAAVTTPTTPTPEPITVVIPAHAPSAALRECLHALSSCVPPPERVILVLDGTSWPEGGLPFVADSVEVVALGRQAGAAAARNAGWRRAVGTWVVFIDSDVAVPGDFMNRLQETMSRLTGVDAFFGSYDANPRAPGLFSRYRNLLHHFTHQTGNEHASTFWTGCGAVKRAALERVGGFDEKVDFMEDIELGMRLLRNGSKITLVKSLQVTHLKRWRLRDSWLTDVRRRALPWSRILIQAGETSRDLNLSPRSRFSGVLAVAGTLLITLTPVSPFLGLAGILSLGLLVAMNARFYAFLARTGGGAALLPGIFFHYLYFLLSSITFAFALVEAAILRKKIFFGPL